MVSLFKVIFMLFRREELFQEENDSSGEDASEEVDFEYRPGMALLSNDEVGGDIYF